MSALDDLDLAREHHLNSCLDNHSEDDCVAVQLAGTLVTLEALLTDRVYVFEVYDDDAIRVEDVRAALKGEQ
jgi:hypothetical protein